MKKISWYILIPVLALFAFSVYFVLTTSNFVRFWADDFCSSVLLRDNGYFRSQIIWWNSWTGRYSYIAFLDFVELFGLVGAQILPFVLFTLFTISLYFVFGFPLSFLLVVIFLVNSPNIIQSFYWMTGSLNYFAPFIFLNFYLSFLFKDKVKHKNIIGFILLFIAAGFSESFAVATFAFLLYVWLIVGNKKNYKILLFGLISITTSLALMYLSPGNSARSASLDHPDGIVDLLTKTFVYSRWYLTHLIYIKEFVISALLLFVGAFIFVDNKKIYFKNPIKVIFISLSFIVGITFIVVGLTYQAMNWEPPMRVMTIVNYMIIYASLVVFTALSQLLSKYINRLFLIPSFLIILILFTFQMYKQWGEVYREVKKYAVGWDAIEDVIIKSEPNSIVLVDDLKPVGKLDGFRENKAWVSSCISSYYGVGKIEVR